MLSNFLFDLPFALFFIYALRVCRERQQIQNQPARLAYFIFWGFLGELVITLVILTILNSSSSAHNLLVSSLKFFSGLHLLLFVALIGCTLAWRTPPLRAQKELLLWLGLVVVMKLIVFFVPPIAYRSAAASGTAMESLQWVVGLPIQIVNFASYVLIFKALFHGRGYPESKIRFIPIPAAASVPHPAATSSTTTKPAPQGMFREEDFIPYVCGVMLLGGFIVIPVMWGSFMRLSYGQAVFSSLISCGVFAASHDKRGNFNWVRFLVLFAFFYISVMRTAMRYGHSNGQPMFLAGGFLGYLVMLGCGWAGIASARWVRKGRPN